MKNTKHGYERSRAAFVGRIATAQSKHITQQGRMAASKGRTTRASRYAPAITRLLNIINGFSNANSTSYQMRITHKRGITSATDASPDVGYQPALTHNQFTVKGEDSLLSVLKFLSGLIQTIKAKNQDSRQSRATHKLHYRINIIVEEKWTKKRRR